MPSRLCPENGFVPYDREPAVLTRANPEYPASELAMGTEGVVYACANIDSSGHIISCWGLKYPNEAFLAACLKALNRFTFSPYVLKGTPVRTAVTVPFRFAMRR